MSDGCIADVIGEQIASLRRARGFSREDLAAECRARGMAASASVITNIETGRKQQGIRRRHVAVDELVVIAGALGVQPLRLVHPELPDREAADATRKGAWVAYYSDGSSFAVFEAEVEAYRHALPMSMNVTFLPYGVDITDHENAQRKAGS